jgi:hypothetical protein
MEKPSIIMAQLGLMMMCLTEMVCRNYLDGKSKLLKGVQNVKQPSALNSILSTLA